MFIATSLPGLIIKLYTNLVEQVGQAVVGRLVLRHHAAMSVVHDDWRRASCYKLAMEQYTPDRQS